MPAHALLGAALAIAYRPGLERTGPAPFAPRLAPLRRPTVHARSATATAVAAEATSGSGFNNDKLNILSPLNPRHFTDAADLYVARVQCRNCTCGYSEGSFAICNSYKSVRRANRAKWNTAKVTVYFALWYVLSIGHSVVNKQVTNVLPLPWSVATAQICVGALFALGLWSSGLRSPPKLSPAAVTTILPIAAFHAIGHIAGIVGTSFGSVSFAQVVKSAGPVYACVLSATVLKQSVSLRVWLSLIPILSGVALATTKELSFAWMALLGAVVSDLALALRNVYSKLSMDKPQGENMNAANHFAVLTCLAALVCLPMALAAEGRVALKLWSAAAPDRASSISLASKIIQTGLFFYGYSEVAMKALKNVHPVTHAIGNTLRRVIIMLICIVVFQTPMSLAGAVGSAMAIGGSYVYAMVKSNEKLAAEKAAADAEEAEGKEGDEAKKGD